MKSPLLIFVVLAALLVSGCAGSRFRPLSKAGDLLTAPDSVPAKSPTTNLSLEKRAEAFARFATGNSYELSGKPELALEEYYRAAQADPANEQLSLELGHRFLQVKQPEKAVEVLSNTAKNPRTTGNVFAQLAQAHLALGKTNQAIHAGRSAVKRSPELISGYQTLTPIYLQTGQIDEAVQILNDASRQTSSDTRFLISLAELYGRVIAANPKEPDALKKRGLEALTRASNQNPPNPNVRQKLADSFSEFGDHKRAAEIYLQLLSEFHDIPMMRDALREKLTNVYLRNSDTSSATEQLEAIVRDSPTRYPMAWYYLGTFAYEARNYAEAADYFSRAIVVNPEMEPAYYELALMQINLNQGGEALKTLEKARAKFSNNFSLEFLSGLAFSRMKNYANAIKHFAAAEMIGKTSDPRRLNYLFYFQFGTMFERNENYTQAEEYFEKCLEMEPEFADALNYLGFMWADRGTNLEKARTLIEKAVQLEPENAAFLDSLGWVLFKLNQHEPALEYLLKAAELSKEPDAVVYDHIGDVYQALNQNEKAREAWQKSIALDPTEAVEKKLKAHSSL